MTKETIIALAAVVGGVLAIGGGVALWSGSKQSAEQPAVTSPVFTESASIEIEDITDTDEGFLEEDVTRIIIQSTDSSRDDIQRILSEKVIINDEVKDIKGLKPANPKG